MKKYEEVYAEIQSFDDNHLERLYSEISDKKEDAMNRVRKYIIAATTLILAFYLISSSAIEEFSFWGYKIKDLDLVLSFIPFAISFIIYRSTNYLAKFTELNIICNLMCRKLYSNNKKSALVNILHPLSFANEKKYDKAKVSLGGCFSAIISLFIFVIPYLTVLISLLSAFIYAYIFVIKNLNFPLRGQDVWSNCLTILTISLLASSLSHIYIPLKNFALWRLKIEDNITFDTEPKKPSEE